MSYMVLPNDNPSAFRYILLHFYHYLFDDTLYNDFVLLLYVIKES